MKYPKSASQIKEQIQHWFYHYHGKPKAEFDGFEVFTLWDLLDNSSREILISKFELGDIELPVLFLKGNQEEVIINTTERFVKLNDKGNESLDYKDFYWHQGFRMSLIKRPDGRKVAYPKIAGNYEWFGLRKTDGNTIYWKLPTGTPGYAFWNVTKKCELIGRKYIIKP